MNVRTKQYMKLLAALPKEIQDAAAEAFELFKENPNHPFFKAKRPKYTKTSNLRPDSVVLRLNQDYRVVYANDQDDKVFYFIGTHRDYDILVGRA